MKIFKRILAIIVAVILTLILSFNIFNFISIKILGNELPTINGYAVLEVISGSMEPKINIGDIVIIDTKTNDYKVKDIVTFKDINGSFVTHRIIGIKDNEIITQGDANNTVDDVINKDQIVGRYIYKINGLGALMKSLRSPLTLVMIFIIGVITCVLVSTDSKGNAILTKEEQEYLEFLESKKNKKEIKEEKGTKETKKNTNKTITKTEKTIKTVTTKAKKQPIKKETTEKDAELKVKKEAIKKVRTKKSPSKKEQSKPTVKKENINKTTKVTKQQPIKKETTQKKTESKIKKETTKKEIVKKTTPKTQTKKTTNTKKTTSKKAKK